MSLISITLAGTITVFLLALQQGGYGGAAIGVDPASEIKISTLSRTINKGRYLKPDDSNTVVVGAGGSRAT